MDGGSFGKSMLRVSNNNIQKMKDRFKYGIFDLDGTIVNSIPTYTETFTEILDRRFGIKGEDVISYYMNSTGTPLEEQFRHVLEMKNNPSKEIPEMIVEFFDIVNKKDFVLYDNAKKVLKELFDKGIKLFLTTGSEDEETKIRLDGAGISKYFTEVLGSSRKEKGPWHIEVFSKVAGKKIDDFSRNAFYVGDGPYDMHIAKMFEIFAIGVSTTVSRDLLIESGADVVVDKIGDIKKLDGLR